MPYSSPFPSIPIPEVDLWSFIFERQDLPYGDEQELFIDAETKRSYNFGEAKSLSAQFGKGLRSAWGFQPGDVFAFYTPNSIDTPLMTLGIHWAGGTACPANPLYTAAELAHQLQDSKASAVVTQLPFLGTVREAAAKAGIKEERIVLLGDLRDESGQFKHWMEIKEKGLFGTRRPKIDHKDLSFVVYSSGTTGLPKGVMLTHHNVVANMNQLKNFDMRLLRHDTDSQLGVLPFFHVYGLVVICLIAMYSGVKTYVMAKFDLERFCQLIQEHQISVTYVPPPIVLGLAKHPIVSKYDLSSLKFLNSAAAPLTKELVEGIWERLRIGVKQGYGLSETSPAASIQTIDEFGKFIGSVGKLVPNMEAKIIGENGEEVPEGEVGELLLKGPNVFPGYLNRPELNSDVFTSDGFFKTGDIVYRDGKGNHYVTDRIKELIKYNGFQVAPAELEGVLLSRPDILDACVIGVWDSQRESEVPRAYVVLKPGTEGSDALAKDIAEWLAKQLAPHKRLRGGVFFIDAVPKSAAGKLLRRVLKEQAKKEGEAKAKL